MTALAESTSSESYESEPLESTSSEITDSLKKQMKANIKMTEKPNFYRPENVPLLKELSRQFAFLAFKCRRRLEDTDDASHCEFLDSETEQTRKREYTDAEYEAMSAELRMSMQSRKIYVRFKDEALQDACETSSSESDSTCSMGTLTSVDVDLGAYYKSEQRRRISSRGDSARCRPELTPTPTPDTDMSIDYQEHFSSRVSHGDHRGSPTPQISKRRNTSNQENIAPRVSLPPAKVDLDVSCSRSDSLSSEYSTTSVTSPPTQKIKLPPFGVRSDVSSPKRPISPPYVTLPEDISSREPTPTPRFEAPLAHSSPTRRKEFVSSLPSSSPSPSSSPMSVSSSTKESPNGKLPMADRTNHPPIPCSLGYLPHSSEDEGRLSDKELIALALNRRRIRLESVISIEKPYLTATTITDSSAPVNKAVDGILLKRPLGVTYDEQTLCWIVADTGNDRVVFWPHNSTGLARSIRGASAVAVVVPGSKLAVLGNDGISMFDYETQKVDLWASIPEIARGLGVTEERNLITLVQYNNRGSWMIAVYSGHQKDMIMSKLTYPYGGGAPSFLDVYNNRLIITDLRNQSISCYRVEAKSQQVISISQAIMRVIDDQSEEGKFKFVSGVQLDGDGHVLIADADRGMLQLFDSNGTFLHKLTFSGGMPYTSGFYVNRQGVLACCQRKMANAPLKLFKLGSESRSC